MRKPDTVSSIELFDDIAIDSRDGHYTENPTRKFSGTANPRHLRVIQAMLLRARKREEIDGIAGASNGPELIAELRRRGLAAPCHRVPAIDRDGFPIRYGVYNLTENDRRKIKTWLRKRQESAISMSDGSDAGGMI